MTERRPWTAAELESISAAHELDIAAITTAGTVRPWMPIWVVRVGDDVSVRSWYRRDTGWFGQVIRSGRARIRVPGLEVEVAVLDAREAAPASEVSAAYRGKYGTAASASMTSPRAIETTLRLVPVD